MMIKNILKYYAYASVLMFVVGFSIGLVGAIPYV